MGEGGMEVGEEGDYIPIATLLFDWSFLSDILVVKGLITFFLTYIVRFAANSTKGTGPLKAVCTHTHARTHARTHAQS